MYATPYESQGKTEVITTTKNHKGFNYALIESFFTFTMTGTRKKTSTHFECNCSVFKEESFVIEFINEITK